MTLHIGAHTTYPLVRSDVDKIASRQDLSVVTIVDCGGIFAMSHCFADELFKRIGHDVKIVNASEFVSRIAEAGRRGAAQDWK
jgi:hypothetical protein